MKVIFLIKGSLERNVPIISQIQIALYNDISVVIICTSCDNKLRDILKDKGAIIIETKHRSHGRGFFKKIIDWIAVKRKFSVLIKKNYSSGSLLYIGSVDTALAIGKILFKYKYILHIRELYDTYPIYLQLLKKYAKNSLANIVPEYNRSFILMNYLKLNTPPSVIPNKPFNHPATKFMQISDIEISKKIHLLKKKKIILYQGHISSDRGLESFFQNILSVINDEWVLVLMGSNHDSIVERLMQKSNKLIYFENVNAPFHLEVTSHAYIGLVSYDSKSLNNIYCAPNKIFEYAGFGIPILGNDIPGLKYTIETNNAGKCINTDDVHSVQNALLSISENYEKYSENSKIFFSLYDNNKLFLDILSTVSKK